jgi:hypothetical protein
MTIVIDQGIHLINNVIRHLTKQFLMNHSSSLIYYP